MKKKSCHRVGFGFDSHKFGTKGTLVLGGVRFAGHPALAGHSDGDALLHAVVDALLGAAGLGDIGEYFSDKSAKYKGISSRVLLGEIQKRVKAAGVCPSHVDVTVVADRPRLMSAKPAIRRQLARDLGISAGSVNIKAKTLEGLSWFKPGDGIAVWAVVTAHG